MRIKDNTGLSIESYDGRFTVLQTSFPEHQVMLGVLGELRSIGNDQYHALLSYRAKAVTFRDGCKTLAIWVNSPTRDPIAIIQFDEGDIIIIAVVNDPAPDEGIIRFDLADPTAIEQIINQIKRICQIPEA